MTIQGEKYEDSSGPAEGFEYPRRTATTDQAAGC